MINGGRLKFGPTPVAKPKDRFGARSALLAMRPGLPAAAEEVLRALDSVQLTAKHQVATPVNWQDGDDVIIVPSVSDEAAKAKFPAGWKAPEAVHADRAAATRLNQPRLVGVDRGGREPHGRCRLTTAPSEPVAQSDRKPRPRQGARAAKHQRCGERHHGDLDT